jgi:transcriptional repressor NF-X1
MPDPASRQTSLKCDDECARLERNRNLAAALHISDGHSDDHVPYSTATLNMYLEDVKWAHAQEELLRAFAADPNERRLRFKPMKSHQRAFVHSIAEDFGFDGESMDPEPHRHVMLFKTPKFVSAPMKTLQQAARIKRGALNIGAPIHSVTSTSTSASIGTTLKHDQLAHKWNGVLLTEPRFGLTVSELQPHIIKAAPTMVFDIYFLTGSEQIILIPSSSSTWESSAQVAELLGSLESKIAAEIKQHDLAKGVSLGIFELSPAAEPRLIYQNGGKDSMSNNSLPGGWSQVAAKGSAPARAPQIQPVGQRPVYTVLGSRLAEAKRKKLEKEEKLRKQAEVVDDWEQEVENNEKSKQTEERLLETKVVEAEDESSTVSGAGDAEAAEKATIAKALD